MIYHAIGLMSGTSLDGLDICYSTFEKDKNNSWKFEILQAETIPYSAAWEKKLREAISLKSEDLAELNSSFGFYLGEAVHDFIQKNKPEKIDVIASHGHTVFHQPMKKFTVQIGDGRAIKLLTGIPVVYDFRSQDVLMGGNGAPLVPIGDRLLFSNYAACLNLGGFSNISFEKSGKRIAFDISPVNTVLNYLAQQKGKIFDEDGLLARSGKTDETILQQLNELPYYSEIPPKSLGIEWVNRQIFPKLQVISPEDALATFTEHVASQISTVFNAFGLKNVLVTGGGAFNSYLLEKIREKSNTEIIIPSKEIINFKEALIFAFMGVLRINNEINVLSSATGSAHDHCTGILA